MKKTAILFFVMTFSFMAFCQELDVTAGSHIVYQVPQYVEPDWYEGATELCPKDQWLRITDEMKQVPLVNNLADAYNVLMVFHSVFSDFECYEHLDVSTAKGMQNMNTSVISDEYSRECADKFRNDMAKAQHSAKVDVDELISQYMEAMSSRYNLEKLMNIDDVFSEETYAAALDYGSLRKDPFSHRCIKAIELAHDTADGLPNHDAEPKLVKVLTAGQYSPLLVEAWETWRALVARLMGQSKDSYIPNEEYNRLRNIACYTMLCHIKDYPDDWVAVNNFLVLASEPNVAIYGPFPFGNQSIMIFYEKFPELLPTSSEEE